MIGSWCLILADNIVLIDVTSKGVNQKLKLRESLENKSYRISRSNIEYMDYMFNPSEIR